MKLSVVIPAYNEEKRIANSISKVIDYLDRKKFDYELIIVDDGSTDTTVEIVQGFNNGKIRLLKNEVNRGKGFSVRRGMLAAENPYILFSDADLSTPITELPRLMKYINGYPIVIGSRRMKGSLIVTRQPWYRSIPGKVFPLMVNLLVLKGIRDTQCGFKLFRRAAAQELFPLQKLERFSFDAEILLLAQLKGYKIKEVPVVWANALDSKLNAVTDSYSMFVELLKVKANFLRGAYTQPKTSSPKVYTSKNTCRNAGKKT
ncbi:MAG: dolichyl-phosphate beta-glucosyltransferase [Candidatus Woesearchaeota archaeon]